MFDECDHPSAVRTAVRLVVAGQRPLSKRDRWRRDKVTGRHAIPLRVEEDLQVVLAWVEADREDLHARVRGVDGTIRERGVIGEANGVHDGKRGAACRAKNRHLHLLVIDLERRRRATLVDGYCRVGVHPPHDGLGRVDLILKQHLSPLVQRADTAKERGPVETCQPSLETTLLQLLTCRCSR